MTRPIKNIGIFTSGGDSPGMNAAVRAAVRTAIYLKKRIFAIMRGYAGMIEDDIFEMHLRSVSNIIQTGGTIIKTSRCPEFLKYEYRKKAFENLKKHKIDSLIAIGGEGTFRGAVEFHSEFRIPIVGIPGTIDNDIYGTDFTIGFDTAVNTALEAIDKIRDTAQSHDRMFLVEVMGRQAGFIGLEAGISGGAEEILIPETPTNIDRICNYVNKRMKKKKTSLIVVVSEGDEAGNTTEIGKKIKRKTGLDYRICVLGHTQRGGCPIAKDRLLASKLGYEAVRALIAGKQNVMVGEINNKIKFTPLKDTYEKKKKLDTSLIKIAQILAT